MFYNMTGRVWSESYIQSNHLGQSSHDTASKEVPQSDIAIITMLTIIAIIAMITAYVQAS